MIHKTVQQSSPVQQAVKMRRLDGNKSGLKMFPPAKISPMLSETHEGFQTLCHLVTNFTWLMPANSDYIEIN